MSRFDDDKREQEFLRSYARELGLEELSSEALAKSLGFDELTPEKLYAWFADEVLGVRPEAGKSGGRVVQVDPDEDPRPATDRLALPEGKGQSREP